MADSPDQTTPLLATTPHVVSAVSEPSPNSITPPVGIAFQARCECGWTSGWWPTEEGAQGDGDAHIGPAKPVDPMVEVAMRASAGERLIAAIGYAEAVLHSHAEANKAPDTKYAILEHCEWLRWGVGRISNTIGHPAKEEGANPS